MLLTLNNSEEWDQEKFESFNLDQKLKRITLVGERDEDDPMCYKHMNKLWITLRKYSPNVKFHIKSNGLHLAESVVSHCDSGTFVIPSMNPTLYEPASKIDLQKLKNLVGQKDWDIEIPMSKEISKDDYFRTIRLCITAGFNKICLMDSLGLGDPIMASDVFKPIKQQGKMTVYKILGAHVIYGVLD